MPEYASIVDEAVTYGKGDLSLTMDKLAVAFGTEITKIVPGYVSTEVDARLSFDTEGRSCLFISTIQHTLSLLCSIAILHMY